MLRDSMVITGLAFVGIVLLALAGNFIFGDFKQSNIVQAMTETARVAALENADNSSRVERGELFIDVDGFEETFNNKIEENISVAKKEGTEVAFDYLVNENGSLRMLKVQMDDGKDIYQATLEVDIAE